MEGIGHGLGGVIDIALQIHQRRPLGQNPLLVPLMHRPGHFFHVSVACTQVDVITDSDDLGQK